jgi:hypothetical protein
MTIAPAIERDKSPDRLFNGLTGATMCPLDNVAETHGNMLDYGLDFAQLTSLELN